MPAGRTAFTDLVRGPIEFDHAVIEDFVILRSDGQPTYHLSVVVDDIDMAITHVLRGEDHISNTPKQILLYQAFGAPLPAFGHVPLILGPDKKRLSKRHGATSVGEYERQGYLAEAMFNFLALLGWSPGTDQEVFTRDELVRSFRLEGISGGNAVFNPEKLDWFNGQHLARLAGDALLNRIEAPLRDAGLWRDSLRAGEREWFLAVVELVKPRWRRVQDIADLTRVFLADTVRFDEGAVAKHLSSPALAPAVSDLADRLERLEPFDRVTSEQALRAVADAHGVKAAPLIHATRVAVTGQAVSPGLFEVLDLVGRAKVSARLRAAAARLAGG
jgi:glutamyl-tRNA synthetase